MILLSAPRSIAYRAVLLTSLLFLLASFLSYQSGFDLWLASNIYEFEGGNGGHFPWVKNYWLYNVLHEDGRWLVKQMFFLTVALFIASLCFERLKPYRSSFLFIILATLVSSSTIATFKHLTTLPCPFSMQTFGGHREWIDYWQLFSPDQPIGQCFPAGHASGGYAWLAIAFLAPQESRQRYLFLLPGILLGLAFGIAQQLRGSHFLSHDLATIACCWFISGTIYHLMKPTWQTTMRLKKRILQE